LSLTKLEAFKSEMVVSENLNWRAPAHLWHGGGGATRPIQKDRDAGT